VRRQAADIDFTKLDAGERATFDDVMPLVQEGYGYDEIAKRIGGDAKTLEANVEHLAAKIMALSGVIDVPPLSEEEFEVLKQSIRDYGQWAPILRGSPTSGLPGAIIDGRGRRRACSQLKLEPTIVDVDGSADQLRALGLVLNMARRHMSASSRRGVVRAKLLADPSLSDRAIAACVGVDHKTVGTVRRELEKKGDVAPASARTGADGVEQPIRERAPQPPPEHRSLRVLVPNDLYEQWVGGWVSCKAFRLVERRPGVHELQVQLVDAIAAGDEQLREVRRSIGAVAKKTGHSLPAAANELLRTTAEVFGREIRTLEDLHEDEAAWLTSRAGILLAERVTA
jgi:hypothetical protein